MGVILTLSFGSLSAQARWCGLDNFNSEDPFRTDDPGTSDYVCESEEQKDKSFLKLYIVLMQDDNGVGHSESSAKVLYQGINKYLSGYGIFLQRKVDFHVVKNSAIYNFTFTSENFNNLFSLSRQAFDPDDGLVLYIFDDLALPNATFSGIANGIRSKYSIIRANPDDTEQLIKIGIHEIGHNLELFHTFHRNILTYYGSVIRWGGVTLFDPISSYFELTNDPLCVAKGDLICDTPSDPGWNFDHYDSLTCKVDVDVNFWKDEIENTYSIGPPNNTYIPILNLHYSLNTEGFEHNHMSYNYNHCRTEFTPDQVEVINCTVNTRIELNPIKLAYDPYVVSNNQTVHLSNTTFENHVIVESGGQLTLTGAIKMPYWGQILVEPGGSLIVDGATISGWLSDDYWQGIWVLGDNTLGGSGLVVIKENSLLVNARTGIFSTDGGRYSVTNSTFLNNIKAIHQKNSARINLSKVENCLFTTEKMSNDYAWSIIDAKGQTQLLQHTYQERNLHEAFITLENCNSIRIQDCTFEIADTWSIDGDAGIGIKLLNSDAAILANTFENLNIALYQSNGPGQGMSNIKRNTFIDNIISIELEESSLSLIEDNVFEVPSPIRFGADHAFGVLMFDAQGVDVLNNTFSSAESSNVFFVAADGTSGQLASNIRHNVFGGSAQSAYRHVELQGSHPMLQLFCNDFNLDNDTEFAIGLESEGSLMDQGVTNAPAGNKWSNLSTCNSISDESQLYKKPNAAGFTYFAHTNVLPGCISSGISLFDVNVVEPLGYCTPPMAPCSFPCNIDSIATLSEQIREILDNPNLIPIGGRQERMAMLRQEQRSIAQRDLISLLTEQDSLTFTLSYLDSLSLYIAEVDIIWLAVYDRYADVSLRGFNKNFTGLPEEEATYLLSTHPHRRFSPMFYQENLKPQEVINSLMPEVEKLTLSVFPNPTKGAFTIQVKDASNAPKSLNGDIVLRDFLGREIYKISIVDALECTISISQRPAGLYFLNYMDSKQEQFSQQILLLP